MGRNRPMITVDPQTVQQIGAVKQAVVALRGEVTKLANEAQRYASAMGAAHGGGIGFAAGGRPANMPTIARPGEAAALRAGGVPLGGGPPPGGTPGGGGAGRRGGLTTGEELLLIAPQLTRIIGQQLGNVIQRERVTTRLAMAQPGVYSGQAAAGRWQQYARGATGYASISDLYGGLSQLSQLGLLRNPNDPQSLQARRDTGLAAIMTGTTFSGAAGMMGGFMSPQTVNALRQGYLGGRSINATPGGQFQLFGNQGVLEQMYQGLGGQRRGEDFYRTGLRPGSPLAQNLGAVGLGQDQQQLIQQYGIMRAEHPEWDADRVQKELSKRYRDTGENLRRFQESMSDLTDVLTGALVPVIDAFVPPLKVVAGTLQWTAEHVPGFKQALGSLIGAIAFAATAIKIKSMLGSTGFMGGAQGLEGAGEAGMMSRVGAGAGGLVSKAGGMMGSEAIGGSGVALGTGATLLSGGAMLLGGVGGSKLGRKVGGKGAGGKVGSVLGGVGGGAATGAALGLMGGPFAELTVPAGAVIGGIVGGIAGLFGDAWPSWEREGGIGDAAPVEPTGGAASGKDLRGAKSSDANMNPEFVKRLAQMFAANPRLSLTSGWRDSATQARLYREKPGLAAPPGSSNHEKGLAADIGPASEYEWIAANAGQFGLYLPMPNTAERKAKKKKIEPWHVEGAGITGGGVVAAPAPMASDTGTTTKKDKTAPVSPEVKAGAGVGRGASYNVATALTSALGGSQIGDAWEPTGDNEVFVGPQRPKNGSGGSRGSITIGRIEINLTIARGTPEEAERTARYLGTLLGDRDRMLELARNGSNGSR